MGAIKQSPRKITKDHLGLFLALQFGSMTIFRIWPKSLCQISFPNEVVILFGCDVINKQPITRGNFWANYSHASKLMVPKEVREMDSPSNFPLHGLVLCFKARRVRFVPYIAKAGLNHFVAYDGSIGNKANNIMNKRVWSAFLPWWELTMKTSQPTDRK